MNKNEETPVEQVVDEVKEKPAVFKTFGLVSMIIGIVVFFLGTVSGLGLDSMRRLAIFALLPLLLIIASLVGITFGIFGIISKNAKIQSIVGLALSSVGLIINLLIILSLT